MIVSADSTVSAGDYAFLIDGVDDSNGIDHRCGGHGVGGGPIRYIVAPTIDHVSSPDLPPDSPNPATLIAGTPSHITIKGWNFGPVQGRGTINLWQAGWLPGDDGYFPPDGRGWKTYSIDSWNDNTIEVTITPDPLATTKNWEVYIFPDTNGGALTDYDVHHPSMGYMNLYDATPTVSGVTPLNDGSNTFNISGSQFGVAQDLVSAQNLIVVCPTDSPTCTQTTPDIRTKFLEFK